MQPPRASKRVDKDAFQLRRYPSGFKIRTMFTPSMWSSVLPKSPTPSCPQPPPIEVVLGEGAQGPEPSWRSRDTGCRTCPGRWAGAAGPRRLSAHPRGTAQTVVSAGILRGSTGGHPRRPAWALNPRRAEKTQGRRPCEDGGLGRAMQPGAQGCLAAEKPEEVGRAPEPLQGAPRLWTVRTSAV